MPVLPVCAHAEVTHICSDVTLCACLTHSQPRGVERAGGGEGSWEHLFSPGIANPSCFLIFQWNSNILKFLLKPAMGKADYWSLVQAF